MFYHNIVIREKNKYINEYQDPPEILDDYDSCCEISIWKDYLNYINKEINKDNIIELSRNATKFLTTNDTFFPLALGLEICCIFVLI